MAITLPAHPRRDAKAIRRSEALRIGVVAPPYFSIPPKGYGGVESVVADLVDGLVDRGHEVTLIGAGRHGTKAQRFLRTYEEPVTHELGDALPEVVHAARAAALLEHQPLDLVHDHTLSGALVAGGRRVPTIVTVHGPATGPMREYYQAVADTVRLVGISDSQRSAAPELPWLTTVYNSVDPSTFPFRSDKDDYALFLGRFHPDKGAHLAIDAARRAGVPIKLAGKCSEPTERDYFESEIQHRIGPDVELLGVADATAKRELLSRAACLLFPICWEEPFGMVMIEAMACGTPVVALKRGAVSEVVDDMTTGVVVDDPCDLPDAVRAARRLDPRACRDHVVRKFSTGVMTRSYENAYLRMLAQTASTAGTGPVTRALSNRTVPSAPQTAERLGATPA